MIHWAILKRQVDASDRMVDIDLYPKDDSIRYFFADVSLNRFADLLDNGVNSRGFRNEVSGIKTNLSQMVFIS